MTQKLFIQLKCLCMCNKYECTHNHRHACMENTPTWPWLLSGGGKQTHSSSPTNCFTSLELNDSGTHGNKILLYKNEDKPQHHIFFFKGETVSCSPNRILCGNTLRYNFHIYKTLYQIPKLMESRLSCAPT